jgi:hypothetical protein
MVKLPTQQEKLYEALAGKGDVSIDTLYRILFDREPPKDAQQRLGPSIVRLNRRLAASRLVVRPGKMKRTYTLQQL